MKTFSEIKTVHDFWFCKLQYITFIYIPYRPLHSTLKLSDTPVWSRILSRTEVCAIASEKTTQLQRIQNTSPVTSRKTHNELVILLKSFLWVPLKQRRVNTTSPLFHKRDDLPQLDRAVVKICEICVLITILKSKWKRAIVKTYVYVVGGASAMSASSWFHQRFLTQLTLQWRWISSKLSARLFRFCQMYLWTEHDELEWNQAKIVSNCMFLSVVTHCRSEN